MEIRPFAYDEGHKAHEAHAVSPAIRRAVDIRKNALAALPLCFYQGYEGDAADDVKIERRPGNIVDVWQRSNHYGLVEELQASLDLQGNGYLKIEENAAGEVTGFYTLPAHRTEPVLTQDRRDIAYYRLAHAGRIYRIDPQEVLHIKEYAPGLSVKGIAPFKAVALAFQANLNTAQLQNDMVRKGGEFSSVLVSPEGRGSVNDPSKMRRLKLRFKKRYRQPVSRRSPIALPPGTKLEKTQLTPAEMRLPELMRMSREQIYEVYGVPLWLVGMQEGGVLGAGGAARSHERIFYEHTIDPMAWRMAWAITTGLLSRFDPTWRCEFDMDGVFALQIAFLERAELVAKACGRAVLTVNEGRAILGEAPLADPLFDELQTLQAPAGGSLTPGIADPSLQNAGKPPADEKPKKKPKMPAPAYSRDERRHRLEKAMAREERHALTYVMRLLNQQEERVIRAVGGARSTSQRIVDVTSLLAETQDDRQLMLDMITDLIERRGADALNELIQDLDFRATNARAAAYITLQANRALSNTTETTRAALRERLAELAGDSTEGIVAAVRAAFDDRRASAVTIARTESASAFNFATLEAWKQTNGMVSGKRWVAILDEHTRDAHAEADGQTVGLDEAFEVGGEMLEFPGDPNGSPEETINCRCALDFVLADEGRKMLDWINRAMGHTNGNGNGHVRKPTLDAILERSQGWHSRNT